MPSLRLTFSTNDGKLHDMTQDAAAASSYAPPPPGLLATLLADDRIVLPIGSVVALVILLGGESLIGNPAWPGRAGILMQQPNALLGLAVTVILCGGVSLIAALIASHRHFDGGVFCGAAALAALAYRCGPMRFALFAASGRGIYFAAAFELIVLMAGVAAPAFLLAGLSSVGWLPRDASKTKDEPIDQKLLAVAIHTVAMILLMMLLCATDRPLQALVSCFAAAYLASMLARAMVPISPSLWLLAGPLLCGLAGYIAQGLTASGLANGDPSGFLAALGRATPLAYAGAGTMGTLLGYWHAVERQEMTPGQLAADIAFGAAEAAATIVK